MNDKPFYYNKNCEKVIINTDNGIEDIYDHDIRDVETAEEFEEIVQLFKKEGNLKYLVSLLCDLLTSGEIEGDKLAFIDIVSLIKTVYGRPTNTGLITQIIRSVAFQDINYIVYFEESVFSSNIIIELILEHEGYMINEVYPKLFDRLSIFDWYKLVKLSPDNIDYLPYKFYNTPYLSGLLNSTPEALEYFTFRYCKSEEEKIKLKFEIDISKEI